MGGIVRSEENRDKRMDSPLIRVSVHISGAVQGVGFRPFVYHLAQKRELNGWVINSSSGVTIDAEGDRPNVDSFLSDLRTDKPPMAVILAMEVSYAEPFGYTNFEIKKSSETEEKTTLVLPDAATCPDCLRETCDQSDRRYRYPFTNCTNCGPRYTIIEKIPYDRPNTSMRVFEMCKPCKEEYRDPDDRRFHAQPVACPTCGPQVFFSDGSGVRLAERNDALLMAIDRILHGDIIALKGIGGFLLLCDATNTNAVARLRRRKHREEKPLAVMFKDLEDLERSCYISKAEKELLVSIQRPIVLLEKRSKDGLAEEVAPNNPYLGVMLPYSPLHSLLMDGLKTPVVATSGNQTDDPIAVTNEEAFRRLSGIADFFLMHNRDIVRRVDDSITRVVDGRPLILRRARGYAPLPASDRKVPDIKVLALGGHLKNTISFCKGGQIFTSQHIGDLETYEATESFKEVISSLSSLYDFVPEVIATDLHPDYISTKMGKLMAEDLGIEVHSIQHHHAHIASCMHEHHLRGQVLGVAWDGTGYGTDGHAWGSEFLVADYSGFERLAHMIPFPLPGGEPSVRKPSHSALGFLMAAFGNELTDRNLRKLPTLSSMKEDELSVLLQMVERRFNSPMVYGVGRFFDAVSSIIGLRQNCSFEGQAAMDLEFEATKCTLKSISPYSYEIQSGSPLKIDWRQMARQIAQDQLNGVRKRDIARRFHVTLADMIVAIAKQSSQEKVVLSGGVFQNVLLLNETRKRLASEHFQVFTHSMIPPNDGGISVGQAAIAIERKSNV